MAAHNITRLIDVRDRWPLPSRTAKGIHTPFMKRINRHILSGLFLPPNEFVPNLKKKKGTNQISRDLGIWEFHVSDYGARVEKSLGASCPPAGEGIKPLCWFTQGNPVGPPWQLGRSTGPHMNKSNMRVAWETRCESERQVWFHLWNIFKCEILLHIVYI